MKKLATVTAVIAAAVLASGCSSGGGSNASTNTTPPEPNTFTVWGTFELQDGVSGTKSNCYGTDGYDDIGPGTQVTVMDSSGDRVGLGELTTVGKSGPYNIYCKFVFHVVDVPGGSDVYSVEVSHRGEFSFRESQARMIDLTLG